MPIFSARSKANLDTCHHDLKRVLEAAIKRTDFTVICGHRTRANQEIAFREGRSKLRYPDSKHNKIPSRAVDVAPCPLDWDDIQSFRDMAKVILEVAKELGVELVWGGNWPTFQDMPHFELPDNKTPT